MNRTHRKSVIGIAAAAAVAALCVWAYAGEREVAQQTQPAARQDQRAAEQSRTATFRLLTFEVGASGPRLGTTVGTGEQEIVDVHNAILLNFAEGDTVELTIGHLGTLRNRVVSRPVPGHKNFPPRKLSAPSSR